MSEGREMTYVSLFSGIEAASVAWAPLGWRPLAFAEIERFPSKVLAERFPDVPNLGDVTKVDWSPYRGADVVVGGSPCFVAGTPVTTARGVIPIEDVVVGDLALTHEGRWRAVLATGSTTSDTVVVKGQGTAAIECTPGHPFWARERHGRSTRVNGKAVRVVDIGEPEWVRADGMDHLYWFCPSEIEPLPVPEFEPSDFTYQTRGEGHLRGFELSEAFFRFVGMWLGDGWANIHRRRERRDSVMKRVYICCAKGEESDMASMLEETGLHWHRSEERTTYRFTCSSNQLYDWIVGNFGVHADGKTLPGWVFGMRDEWRRALYDGYLSTDGHRAGRNMRSASVSRCLTVGMKTLAATLGIVTSVVRTESKRRLEIEGRKVNERPYYTQTYYERSRSAFSMDGGWWGLVRSVSPGSRDVTVYNLEVEGDNSYAADGIAVHNCQSFSVAGNRGGVGRPARSPHARVR